MDVQVIIIIAILGYGLGNFQTGLIVGKIRGLSDVREHGSGNAGATNMLRVYGYRAGIVTFLGDAAKCALAVLIGHVLGKAIGLMDGDAELSALLGGYIGGFTCIVGHCWPALFAFRGGKGSSCTFAFLCATFPLGAGIVAAVLIAVYLISKRVSVVSIVGAVVFIALTFIFRRNYPYYQIASIAYVAVVLLRHIPNIIRLIRGTEKELHREKSE
ncbi:MAG: glycerol-3-phosphate acyltransferase [Clostridiales bacterium]|nr:glycerol-3-phosphate acyltransferase [Clostridiales bacterium]